MTSSKTWASSTLCTTTSKRSISNLSPKPSAIIFSNRVLSWCREWTSHKKSIRSTQRSKRYYRKHNWLNRSSPCLISFKPWSAHASRATHTSRDRDRLHSKLSWARRVHLRKTRFPWVRFWPFTLTSSWEREAWKIYKRDSSRKNTWNRSYNSLLT